MPHLPLLTAEGIRHIELRRLPHHLDYTDQAALKRLATALQEQGVAVHSLHVPDEFITKLSALDEGVRKAAVTEVRKMAAALRRIAGKILVTHAGGRLKDEAERPLQFAAGQGSIAELGAFCQDMGLAVAVENSLPTRPRLGDTVAEVVRFVEGIGAENVGYCLDTSHANIGGDVVRALRLVKHHLLALHISDNDGQSDQHALPFDGSVDWAAFMAELESVDYPGVFMVEVRPTQRPQQMLQAAQARFDSLMAMCQAR